MVKENTIGNNIWLVVWREAEPEKWNKCVGDNRQRLNMYTGTKCNKTILIGKENKVNIRAKQIVANREVLSKALAHGS